MVSIKNGECLSHEILEESVGYKSYIRSKREESPSSIRDSYEKRAITPIAAGNRREMMECR
jgi:hypothetical protein